MTPWEAIGWGAKVLALVLEGIPIEQRRATSLVTFWSVWPLMRLNPEIAKHEKEILAAMEKIGK